jgi:hypothetical protein
LIPHSEDRYPVNLLTFTTGHQAIPLGFVQGEHLLDKCFKEFDVSVTAKLD